MLLHARAVAGDSHTHQCHEASKKTNTNQIISLQRRVRRMTKTRQYASSKGLHSRLLLCDWDPSNFDASSICQHLQIIRLHLDPRPTLAGIVKVPCANGFADLIPVSALVMELAQEQKVSGSFLQDLENIMFIHLVPHMFKTQYPIGPSEN